MRYSIVRYSEINKLSCRIDAEFYQFEKIIKLLNKSECFNLNNESDLITQGPNPVFTQSGIPCLTGRNISNGCIDFDESDFVSIKTHDDFSRFHIKNYDILITLKGAGSTGKVAIFTGDKKSIFSRNVGIVRLSKNSSISPLYLYAVLCSDLGQKIIDRGVTGGTGQLTLPTTYLKNINLPKFKELFISRIHDSVKSYLKLLEESKLLYQQAENLFLEELGLKDWKPKHQLSYVKNYSDTQQTERFDAEYFQPQYDAIIERIKNYKNGFDFAKKIISLNNKNYQPIGDKDYRYIELSNISKNGEINGFIESKGEELPSRARRKVKKGDLILSSIEGSLDSIAMITDNYENMLCSTGFFVANSKNINAETALIFFKSQVGQLQLKKGCSGTILTAIGSDEFNKILIPKIEQKVQDEIKEKINKMYLFKSQSKSLLEIAKKAVEMAMESNEEKATKWIDQELERLGVRLSND